MSARTNALASRTKLDTPANIGRHDAGPGIMTDAPFRSVESAIRFAYGMEGQAIVKVSNHLTSLRGSTVRGKRRSDGPWDDHAQAALILHMIERILQPHQMICVRGYYTQPKDDMLEMRKQVDYRLLAELFRGETRTDIDQRFVADVVRGWVGDRRHHQDKWWAAHLNVHPKTIQFCINGRRDRGVIGIIPFLDGIRIGAIDAMYGPMAEAELVVE